jgi:hypothetical protein
MDDADEGALIRPHHPHILLSFMCCIFRVARVPARDEEQQVDDLNDDVAISPSKSAEPPQI